MNTFLECALFLFGLALGSFLNVCISRIPRDQSIIVPRSRCLACAAPIPWYDNIPLLSWVLLRGRCRGCGAGISWRYPAVEWLTAVLFVACFARFGFTWLTLKFCIFCFLLVGLIFMDAETGLLPREFTYTGIVLGLVLSWFALTDSAATAIFVRAYGIADRISSRQLSFLDSLMGALFGAGFFYLAWALYYLVRKRHGMGFGDIALMAMAGAFLGVKLSIFVLFTAPVLGALYAIAWLVGTAAYRSATGSPGDAQASPNTREMFLAGEFPFGVFLGICSLAAIFVGEAAWIRYLGFF